ncbi:MAG: TolC family protein, partial [Flavobacteriales bacterium]|nr:TolC family protein [Flavobacteriales bacterium]
MKKVKSSILAILSLAVLGISPLHAQNVTYSLDKCRQLALQNNKQMGIMEQKVIKAQQEHLSAKTKYLPSVSATGTYLYNSRDLSLISNDMYLPIGTVMADGSFGFTQDQINNKWTVIDGQPVPLDANGVPFNPKTDPSKILWKQHAIIPKSALTFDTQNIFAAAFTITQPVYMGGKIRAYNKITQYAQTLAENQKDTKATEIILSVDQAYWTIVSLESKKKLAESYHSLLLKLKSDVGKLKTGGLATRADELSVEVKLNEAEMTLTRVEDGIALSKMNLAQFCGLDMTADFTLEDAGKEFRVTPKSK